MTEKKKKRTVSKRYTSILGEMLCALAQAETERERCKTARRMELCADCADFRKCELMDTIKSLCDANFGFAKYIQRIKENKNEIKKH